MKHNLKKIPFKAKPKPKKIAMSRSKRIHYSQFGSILCNTASVNIQSTRRIDAVTCKNCIAVYKAREKRERMKKLFGRARIIIRKPIKVNFPFLRKEYRK